MPTLPPFDEFFLQMKPVFFVLLAIFAIAMSAPAPTLLLGPVTPLVVGTTTIAAADLAAYALLAKAALAKGIVLAEALQ